MFGSTARRRRLHEERLYEIAVQEIERGEQRKGLWAKALADANFDHDGAKARYLKLRVQSLADAEAEAAHETNQAKSSPASAAQTKPIPSPKIEDDPGPSTDNSPSAKRSWVSRIVGFVFWISLGVATYQFIDWLVFGHRHTLNPLDFISSLFFSLWHLGELEIGLVQLAMYVALGFCTFRAIKALRNREI